MVKTDDDICEISNGNNNNLIYNLFKVHSAKYGNIFDPCPISVCQLKLHFEFASLISLIQGKRYFKNWPIDFSTLPEIIPGGEFRIDILAYINSENKTRIPLYLVNIFVEVKTKTALQWKQLVMLQLKYIQQILSTFCLPKLKYMCSVVKNVFIS